MGRDQEREARMGLACVVEPGDPRVLPLLAEFGAQEVWGSVVARPSGVWGRRAEGLDVAGVRRRGVEAGVRFVIPGDDEWPEGLGVLDGCEPVQDSVGAPVGLWLRGEGHLATVVASSVAVVGARASSAYGEQVAADVAAGVGERGFAVVSGGAYGIDAAAHRGVLAAEGVSVAVVAGGLDGAYPRAHEGLFAQIARTGVVVSEVPPGEHPTRRRFLTRNRLIAALTLGTVVVEAAARSGARNTASWAAACGRVVMAVPGSVHSATSVTPHRLIRDQEAVLVTGPDDVVEMVGPVGGAREESVGGHERLLDLLTDVQRAVREELPVRGGRDAGEIAVRVGLPLPVCLGALEELALAGHAEPTADGRWRLGATSNRPIKGATGGS